MGSTTDELHQIEHADTLHTYGDIHINAGLVAKFLPGTRILPAECYGTSEWTSTARLRLELPNGGMERYFLKCTSAEIGRQLMEGEFQAMLELYKTMPSMTPRPHSWGKLAAPYPETYFYLQEYLDLTSQLPEPDQLGQKLALLHRQSASPTGKFGFHVNTCQGRTQQSVGWEGSWTTLLVKMLQHVIGLDFAANGYWRELDVLERRIISRVIPRLIGILESDGQSIKPSLIHGDLWEGNIGTALATGDIYVFDAAALYAHNEMEIGNWRCYYNRIHDQRYTQAYLRHFAPSEPTEEWNDRNRMYSIYYNIIFSVNHMTQGLAVRQTTYDDMYYLIDKYAPFEECQGPRRLAQEERVSLSAERDHTLA